MLKRFNNLLLILVCAVPLLAQQPAPKTPEGGVEQYAVVGAQKDAIDLPATKIKNLNLAGKQAQIELQNYVADLTRQYDEQKVLLDAAVEKARVALKLPPEAVFNYERFAFTIPTKAPVPIVPPAEVKKKPVSFKMTGYSNPQTAPSLRFGRAYLGTISVAAYFDSINSADTRQAQIYTLCNKTNWPQSLQCQDEALMTIRMIESQLK